MHHTLSPLGLVHVPFITEPNSPWPSSFSNFTAWLSMSAGLLLACGAGDPLATESPGAVLPRVIGGFAFGTGATQKATITQIM